MVEKFLSEDESVKTSYGNFYLTNDRLIRLNDGNKNREYKDIQLENIASFYHSKKFNETLALVGGLILIGGVSSASTNIPPQASIIISVVGLGAIIHAYLTIEKKYKVRSDAGIKMSLPDSNKTIKFWKKINQEKNH